MGKLHLYRPNELQSLCERLNHALSSDAGHILLIDRPLEEKQKAIIEDLEMLVCFAVDSSYWKRNKWPSYVVGLLQDPTNEQEVSWAFEQAKRVIQLQQEKKRLEIGLLQKERQTKRLLESALHLSAGVDFERLCEQVLSIIRELTNAEGSSLSIVDPNQKGFLIFKNVQNERLQLELGEFQIAIDETSIIGACAYRKDIIHLSDVYQIPENETFQFNRKVDQETGYRTRAVLCVPLIKLGGELIGVIQILNKKSGRDFSEEDIEMGKALSAHIAAGLEKALLYDNIEQLFEGFIRASVTAIESRDPSTSGHSERVAKYTENIAHAVTDSDHKAFRGKNFSDQHLKEIRYASLLHDFGKIGVAEQVLQKAKKLYPTELEQVQLRFQILKAAHPKEADHIEEVWQSIINANEPSILKEDIKEKLENFLNKTYQVFDEELPLLKEGEFKKLIIPKGSLSSEERRQIESHVTHTRNFLDKIPWTSTLSHVPAIAGAHHERLNGSGYPHGWPQDKIPYESQMMAVADVYDALTARDRPYKPAVAHDKAIQILRAMVNSEELNSDIVQLFEEKNLFKIDS